jgi:hypothetical protein
LIYFIFRDDTYVISLIIACLMIVGELTVGVRILLEKGLSRHHIFGDQQFQENTQKFLFCQETEVARRRGRGEPPGAHTTPWHGPALAAPPGGVAALAHFCQCPLHVYLPLRNLRLGGGSQKDSAASAGQKTHRERKLSGRQKSVGEIPSLRGEIVAIVTIIELGFIGIIIIIIIIITSTFITIITMPTRCNILG